MKKPYPLGTTLVPKAPAWRLVAFLRVLGWALAGSAAALGIAAALQLAFHPFDALIESVRLGLGEADSALQGEVFAGISAGVIVLVVAAAALPLVERGVKKKQYGLSFWRGLLSSAVFLGTDRLYRFAQGLGRLYLVSTLALVFAATAILVELVSRIGKAEGESDRRTELLASIVSALAFGLLARLAGGA